MLPYATLVVLLLTIVISVFNIVLSLRDLREYRENQ
jgi:hypothetical protein